MRAGNNDYDPLPLEFLCGHVNKPLGVVYYRGRLMRGSPKGAINFITLKDFFQTLSLLQCIEI